MLEQLDGPTLESLRERATARLRAAEPGGDHPMLLTAWIVTARRP